MKHIALALVVLLPALAGCGGGGTKLTHTTSEPVKLTVYTWTRPAETAVNQELCRRFEANHPNIRVEVLSEPGERAMEKLQAMVAAGNPPDVMSIHGAYFMPMAADKALLDLEPFIKEDKDFDLADFYPGLVKQCRYQGTLYSLPRYTSVYVLFYNRDLFDTAGLPYPNDTWTWDDYLAAAKKLTIPAKKQWGAVIDFWGSRIYPWVWSAGGEVLDKTGKRCLLDQPGAVRALQFLVDLRLKYQACPANTVAEKKQNIAMFTSGQIGMYQTGAWDIQSMRDVKTLRWDVAPLPMWRPNVGFDGNQKWMTAEELSAGSGHATLLGMENYAIAAGTKHPKEAWELFKFLLGKEAQGVMATKLEKQPSRQSVANDVFLKLKTGYNTQVFVDAMTYARQAPNVAEWDRVSHFIQEQLDLMWVGKISVKEGCAKAAKQVTKGLNEP